MPAHSLSDEREERHTYEFTSRFAARVLKHTVDTYVDVKAATSMRHYQKVECHKIIFIFVHESRRNYVATSRTAHTTEMFS
jgi:hypothetical protein